MVSTALWNAKSLGHSGGTGAWLPDGDVDADSGDWLEKPAEWLISRMQPITQNAQQSLANGPSSSGDGSGAGDILCLHDGTHRQMDGDRSRTLAALEHWLPRWRDLGLEFVTIGEAVNTTAP